MEKLNNQGANSVSQNSANVNPQTTGFEKLKRDFERDYQNGDCEKSLTALARAVAASVLKKIYDASGNPVMNAMRRDLQHDIHLLDNLRDVSNRSTKADVGKNGKPVTIIADKEAYNAESKLIEETLSDSSDLVQEAAMALLEQAVEHAGTSGWLDKPYTVTRLAKQVYIQLEDSKAYRDEQTTPIQEVYRAARRVVENNRAVKSASEKYLYIDATEPDSVDTVYFRAGLYSDIGSFDRNGNYTAGIEEAKEHEFTLDEWGTILDRLNLTESQEIIVDMRIKGYGDKAIARYIGVKRNTVIKHRERIQKKCEKIGFTPDMWREMTDHDDN